MQNGCTPVCMYQTYLSYLCSITVCAGLLQILLSIIGWWWELWFINMGDKMVKYITMYKKMNCRKIVKITRVGGSRICKKSEFLLIEKNHGIWFTFLSYFASQRSNHSPAYYMHIILSKINILLTFHVIMSCLYSKTVFKQLKLYDWI